MGREKTIITCHLQTKGTEIARLVKILEEDIDYFS